MHQANYFTSLVASTMAAKGTLNEHHVNLESNIGEFLKRSMNLPFKEHSRVDIQEAALQAYRTFQQAPSQFFNPRTQYSAVETEAATRYKGFGFSTINNALRTDATALTDEGRQTVNALDVLTHSGVVQQDFSVHRGFSGRGLDRTRSLVGQQFTDQGFSSTSLNPYVVDEFARTKDHFTAEIRLKKGSKGFLLSSHDIWKQGDKEAEFVLPRGTTFKVLEEHAAESAWAPRHLVLEAITPEHVPTPLQLGRQVAHAVYPTPGGAMATAQKMAVKGTANELHTVLESGVGGFFKKLFKMPLKAHSQTDPLAAAKAAGQDLRAAAGEEVVQPGSAPTPRSPEEWARLEAQRVRLAAEAAAAAAKTESTAVGKKTVSSLSKEIKGKSYAGILIAGALAIGGAITLKGWATVNDAISDHQQDSKNRHGYATPVHHNSPLLGGQEHFSIRRIAAQAPGGSTKIVLDDAQLDHSQVDQAFAMHMRGGLAYGRRSS